METGVDVFNNDCDLKKEHIHQLSNTAIAEDQIYMVCTASLLYKPSYFQGGLRPTLAHE